MTSVTIRPARSCECVDLSALALRSKAYWGYDRDFLAACADVLWVAPEQVESGLVFVAEDVAGNVLGVAVIAPPEATGEGELDMLFVDPEAIGTGIGSPLFEHAAASLTERGASTMRIVADPGAAGFYQHMGATIIGTEVSEVDPGRRLPLLKYDLGSARA